MEPTRILNSKWDAHIVHQTALPKDTFPKNCPAEVLVGHTHSDASLPKHCCHSSFGQTTQKTVMHSMTSRLISAIHSLYLVKRNYCAASDKGLGCCRGLATDIIPQYDDTIMAIAITNTFQIDGKWYCITSHYLAITGYPIVVDGLFLGFNMVSDMLLQFSKILFHLDQYILVQIMLCCECIL
jgi:hypothetical protein